MRPEVWLNVAGYLTWMVAGVPTIAAIAQGGVQGPRAWCWSVAYGCFGAAFTLCFYGGGARRLRGTLLAVQSASAMTLVVAGQHELAPALFVVVAGQMMGVASGTVALSWVVAQSAVTTAVLVGVMSLASAAMVGGAFAGFQLFALATSALARRERLTSEALRATRAQLAAQSRAEERLSIARDLHDTLGHHLTALSVQLDVASRLTEGKAAEHVSRAHAVARLLLGDVRDVVSRLREPESVDVSAAARALAEGVQGVQVHLDVPPTLVVHDEARAQALVRSVQEVLTNVARHARATDVWIRIAEEGRGIAVHARDNGRGTDQVSLGHGLMGMRERFEACGGRVGIESRAGRGFEIHGFLPTPEDGARARP